MSKHDELMHEIEEARALRHPQRLMRVTLECGHLRLMPAIGTVMGIGSYTACFMCLERPTRLVVNVEETGVPGAHFRHDPPSRPTSAPLTPPDGSGAPTSADGDEKAGEGL